MKKYIKTSNELYGLNELIQDQDKLLQALGFVNIDGVYAGTIGVGLVLYSMDSDSYYFIRNGANYADEIITGLVSGSGINELVDELGLTYHEYNYFEEI